MNKLNIGCFIDKKSWLHQVDPRLKLVANVLLLIVVFALRSLILLAFFDLLIIATFLSLNLGSKCLVSILKWIVPLAVVQFLLEAWMFPPGDLVFFSHPHFKIGNQTLTQPGRTLLRIYAMFLIVTMFSATTRPLAVTKAIEDLLLPLKWIKFPVHIIAMVIAIALQFSPSMVDHAKKVTQAQAARGFDFKHSPWVRKIAAIKVIGIPMLAAAFNNALQLGYAMDARAYDPYARQSSLQKFTVNYIGLVLLGLAVTAVMAVFLIPHEMHWPQWWV